MLAEAAAPMTSLWAAVRPMGRLCALLGKVGGQYHNG